MDYEQLELDFSGKTVTIAEELELTDEILKEFRSERIRQILKWGHQNHPDFPAGRDLENAKIDRDEVIRDVDEAFKNGQGNWWYILSEEAFEAFAVENNEELEEELIQVGAVVVAWIQNLRERRAASVQ